MNPRTISRQTVTALKGFSIILIFIYHVGGYLATRTFDGYVGVDLFVLASGYGISRSAQSYFGDGWGFLKHRFLRFYPAYFIVLTICSLLLGISLYQWLIHAALLQLILTDHFFDIDNAYWYMAFISYCYIYIAILNRRHCLKFIFPIALFLTLASAYYLSHTPGRMHQIIITHAVVRIPIFAGGFWLGANYAFADGNQDTARSSIWDPIALFALWICYLPALYHNIMIAVLLLILFFCMIRIEWIHHILFVLGTLSYEIYLVHDPLLRELKIHLPHASPYIYMIVFWITGATVSLAFAGLLHILLDRCLYRRLASKN